MSAPREVCSPGCEKSEVDLNYPLGIPKMQAIPFPGVFVKGSGSWRSMAYIKGEEGGRVNRELSDNLERGQVFSDCIYFFIQAWMYRSMGSPLTRTKYL